MSNIHRLLAISNNYIWHTNKLFLILKPKRGVISKVFCVPGMVLNPCVYYITLVLSQNSQCIDPLFWIRILEPGAIIANRTQHQDQNSRPRDSLSLQVMCCVCPPSGEVEYGKWVRLTQNFKWLLVSQAACQHNWPCQRPENHIISTNKQLVINSLKGLNQLRTQGTPNNSGLHYFYWRAAKNSPLKIQEDINPVSWLYLTVVGRLSEAGRKGHGDCLPLMCSSDLESLQQRV